MAKRSDNNPIVGKEIKVNSLDEIINPDDYQADFKKPDDFMGRPFIIMGFEMKPGKQGDFAHINAIDVLTGEATVISTGGKLILPALADIQAKGGFPVLTTFGRSGSAFQFRAVQVNRNMNLAGMVEKYLYGEQQELPGQEWSNTTD